MLLLNSLSYEHNHLDLSTDTWDNWRLDGLEFSPQLTMITGLNAAGKTRTYNVLKNTIKVITGQVPPLQYGDKALDITINDGKHYEIIIKIQQGENNKPFIKEERLYKVGRNKKVLLFDRSTIYDSSIKKGIKYSPPDNSLTFHVRRDKVSHPYIEEIVGNLNNFHSLDFEEPKILTIGSIIEKRLPLELLPSWTPICFEQLVSDETKRTILEELNSVGFLITDIFIKPIIQGSFKVPMLYLQEKGVQKTYSFIDASSGLKKALFLIVILYLLDKGSCVLIDNLGDGLDYKRSIEIVRILNDKAKEMQLIVCTNNESLLNYTDIRNWNVLHREGEHVKAFNYRNSKERILQFADSGLSNYEFFKEEYYFKGPDRL